MIGMIGIKKVIVPVNCISLMHEYLRRAGQVRAEAFVLWAGRPAEEVFRVHQAYVPNQLAIQTQFGVCVKVEADELHRLNVWLYENGFELIAQIHSHPTEAFHSDTDDTYPIVATVGAFSIVVPNFAREPFSWGNCAVFRLTSDAGWVELSQADVKGIFVNED